MEVLVSQRKNIIFERHLLKGYGKAHNQVWEDKTNQLLNTLFALSNM